MEKIPDVYVVGGEEPETVFACNRPLWITWVSTAVREGPQLGEASRKWADRRVLGGGEAAELDWGTCAFRLVIESAALVGAQFVHRDVEAALSQFLSGGEPGDAAAEDRDSAASLARPGGCDGFGHDCVIRSSASSPGCDGARTAAWT